MDPRLRGDDEIGNSQAKAPATVAVVAALLAYVVLVLVLNRALLGRDQYLSLLAGGLHTSAMLIMLALVLATNPSRTGSTA
jgi:hypothetical protein